ncbi:hypothetical protein Q427_00240 [Halomonas sp. BC04]|nr:hypothetical protein Q427_00240 [Halomonas sp. BC04]
MVGLLGLLMLVSLATGESAHGYPRTLVAEPLAEEMSPTQRFRGAARILGELAEGERHAFTWSIDDREVDHLWQISLRATTDERLQVSLHADQAREGQGAPQGVTTFGEASADTPPASDGEVETGSALLTLEATPDIPGDRVTSLLVPHGDYRLEVETQGWHDEYQLTVEPTEEISLHGTANAPSDAETLAIGPGRDWFYQLNAERLQLPLELDEGDTRRWRLSLLTELGHTLRAQPVDAAGKPLEESTMAVPREQRWTGWPSRMGPHWPWRARKAGRSSGVCVCVSSRKNHSHHRYLSRWPRHAKRP